MSRKEAVAARPGPDGRRPLLVTFVGNNRQMLNEIRDSLSHLRKNDVAEGHHPHYFADHHNAVGPGGLLLQPPPLLLNKHDLSQSTPNLVDKANPGNASSQGGSGSKMTRRGDNPHDKALAEIRDSLRPFQNTTTSLRSNSSQHAMHNGVSSGGSDNGSVASSTSSHATSSDPEPSPSKVQLITQYGFDEDLAVRALKLSGNQSADAALRLLFDLFRTTTAGMHMLTPRSGLGPSSPSASDTTSVRSDSPGVPGVQGVPAQRQQQPPPLPPRAPINSGVPGIARGATPPLTSPDTSLMAHQGHHGAAVYSQYSKIHHQAVGKGPSGKSGVLPQHHPMGNGGGPQGGLMQPTGAGPHLVGQGQGQHTTGVATSVNLSGQVQHTTGSGPGSVPHGHVQQMIQLMSPTAGQPPTAFYQQQQIATSTSSGSTGGMTAIVPGKRGMSPLGHQHHPMMLGGSQAGSSAPSPSPLNSQHHPVIMGRQASSGSSSAPSPLLNQQLQNLVLAGSGHSSPISSPRYTQAPPPSYSQAQAQMKAARMGAAAAITAVESMSSASSSVTSDRPSDRPSPLLDVTMLPELQQQYHMLHHKSGVASSAVSATRVNWTHTPVIMQSVCSKEVTKPMPQTATAPAVPPVTSASPAPTLHHHQQQQHRPFVNGHIASSQHQHVPPSGIPSSQHQQHHQSPRTSTNNNNQTVVPGSLVPQLLQNGAGAGFTPEQLAALAAASAGQPTVPTYFTSKRAAGLYRHFNNNRDPASGGVIMSTPRSDSPVSRTTNQSPMSILSTTSSPSTNSDIPDKPPPPYPGRGGANNNAALVTGTPPIIPPLLPPRVPLKDKPPPPPPPASSILPSYSSSVFTNPSLAMPQTTNSAISPHNTSLSQQAPPSQRDTPHNTQRETLPESSTPPSETDETDTDASSISAGTTSSASAATTSILADSARTGGSTTPASGNNSQQETTTTTTRCMSPLPQRKSEARERDRLRSDMKVRNYSPQAFKFYMEQHVENVLKSHSQRMNRRLQLEKEMAKVKLSEEAARQMRKMLHQKESNYIRLKRAKMDPSMFEKIKTLGVGAFGEVALVRKKDVGSLYAMKTLTKSNVIKRNQVAHVKAERDILAEADNEWVVKLYYSFQDETNLYFVMDYVPGGDLMGQLIRKEILDEHLAQFYIAELVLAIESVHRMGFIHRDIKPDNILIDQDGHIKLTDFGLCTGFRWTHNSKYYQKDGTHARQDSMEVNCQLDDQCRCEILKPLEQRRAREQKRGQAHSLVGTPNYIAPEVLCRLGYTKVCDWWSVGVILYEMVIGQPPFYANTPLETQYKVIHWKDTLNMQYCMNISAEAQDLIRQLLQGPESRLGRNGALEIKQHPFFGGINFEGLRRQPAPEKPTIRFLTDTSNFDPVDPDKLRPNDSDASSKKADGTKTENGKHPEHAFYEFTFRRFFDDGGHPCAMPSSSSVVMPSAASPQVPDQDGNGAPVYV